MEGKATWRRRINRYSPLATAIAGILLVFGGVIFVAEGAARIAAIAAGLVVLEVGVWYMANPVFTSERRYVRLRGELDHFIDLVRELNRTAVAAGAREELERVKSAMYESVDEMVELAGKEGVPPSGSPSP